MRIVNRKKFIKSILALIFMIVITFICFSQIFNKPEVIENHITYTVSRGERLWDIAKKYKLENQDIREYIFEVRKLNNMESATIYEGQEITIITYEEVK